MPALRWLSFLATASGAIGYRKIRQFGRRNAALFTHSFALAHGLPSPVSGRNLLQALDKKAVAQVS